MHHLGDLCAATIGPFHSQPANASRPCSNSSSGLLLTFNFPQDLRIYTLGVSVFVPTLLLRKPYPNHSPDFLVYVHTPPQDTLRNALALGADRALHVPSDTGSVTLQFSKSRTIGGVTRGYRDGLQPETLADGNWLVKQNQPVSKIETKSDTNLRSLYDW